MTLTEWTLVVLMITATAVLFVMFLIGIAVLHDYWRDR